MKVYFSSQQAFLRRPLDWLSSLQGFRAALGWELGQACENSTWKSSYFSYFQVVSLVTFKQYNGQKSLKTCRHTLHSDFYFHATLIAKKQKLVRKFSCHQTASAVILEMRGSDQYFCVQFEKKKLWIEYVFLCKYCYSNLLFTKCDLSSGLKALILSLSLPFRVN